MCKSTCLIARVGAPIPVANAEGLDWTFCQNADGGDETAKQKRRSKSDRAHDSHPKLIDPQLRCTFGSSATRELHHLLVEFRCGNARKVIADDCESLGADLLRGNDIIGLVEVAIVDVVAASIKDADECSATKVAQRVP
jgi:hypothetical protein